MQPQRILIVEDDAALATLMGQCLAREGYAVEIEGRGDAAVERIRALDPDLVVLDVMLPGRDGFEVCRALRPDYRGRILFLTARGDDIDHVAGLELGADDFVVKPIRPRVLVARIRALLRRPATQSTPALTLGALTISPASRRVDVRGTPVELTDAEYDLLEYLARAAGRIIGREELYDALRGIPYDGADRSMDLRIARLRAALRPLMGERVPIRTVRGRGYMMERDR